jgi:MFS family permease
MSAPNRTPAVLALAVVQGFLGMGFQLVASRLLAPFFGTTLIVWAFLISTFLAAFSLGSFAGGLISQLELSRRRFWLAVLSCIGTACFGLAAAIGQPILRTIEPAFEELWLAVFISCGLLFLLPVAALSALLPIYAELVGQNGARAGVSSGLIYGLSTLGNIVGVIVTAFALIPNFHTSELLVGWAVCAPACFATAYRIAR